MTKNIVTTIGQEWIMSTDISGLSGIDVGLYRDGTGVGQSNPNVGTDLGDAESPANSEPNGNDYDRATGVDITVSKMDGLYGFDNDTEITFNCGDSTSVVNAYFLVALFDSTEAGDGGLPDFHVVATGDLGESRDLTDLTQIKLAAGTGNTGIGMRIVTSGA